MIAKRFAPLALSLSFIFLSHAAHAQAAFPTIDPTMFDPASTFDPTAPFDPNNPIANSPAPVTPIEPVELPDQDFETDATTLPAPVDEEVFDFFQPGYQLTDDDLNKKLTDDDSNKKEVVKPKKVAKPRPTYQRLFNYRNQRLPHEIYKKQYRPENRHLPTAFYEHEYDAATFQAAARNNLHGLRALINSGRSLTMVNPQGETLAGVAARNNAHTTLRYLLAKGVTHFGAQQPSRYDTQTLVAVRSAQTPTYAQPKPEEE
ncbi:MAG: ankyrin repeat domain-containing protein [Rickettsiales bacterium]|nr:ankyrin repeat domain-containing protein [Rickettsiales bacterium]